MGKGQVVKTGWAIKFVANLNPAPLTHIEEKVTSPVTVATVPETLVQQELEVSRAHEVSPVTTVPEPDPLDEQWGSTELKWLLQLLSDMEGSKDAGIVHPRFTSKEQVNKLYEKAMIEGEQCMDQLLATCSKYWDRLIVAVDVVHNLLDETELRPGQRVKVGSHYGSLSAKM